MDRIETIAPHIMLPVGDITVQYADQKGIISLQTCLCDTAESQLHPEPHVIFSLLGDSSR